MEIKTFKFTNIKLDRGLQDYIWKKMMRLEKFLGKMGLPQDLHIEAGKSTAHHKEGRIFRVEATLEIPGKVLRAESCEFDLRVAADNVYNELAREIKELKGQLRAKQRQGARVIKNLEVNL